VGHLEPKFQGEGVVLAIASTALARRALRRAVKTVYNVTVSGVCVCVCVCVCVVLASRKAVSDPTGARALGEASIGLSVVGILIGLLVVFIWISYP